MFHGAWFCPLFEPTVNDAAEHGSANDDHVARRDHIDHRARDNHDVDARRNHVDEYYVNDQHHHDEYHDDHYHDDGGVNSLPPPQGEVPTQEAGG